MIRGVIFDLGNTLMFWEGNGEEIEARSNAALVAFLKDNGVDVGDDFVSLLRAQREKGWKLAEETNVEHTLGEALQAALAQVGDRSLDGLLPQAVERYFCESERQSRAYADAVPTLEALRQRGLAVGMISNADDDSLVQRMVVRLGLGPFLDPVVSSAGLGWRKPDPNIFHFVARRWGLPPQEIAMVGDSPRYDILGAHRAGMRGILVDRGENLWWQSIPAELSDDPAIRPDATVNTLTEILTLVDKL